MNSSTRRHSIAGALALAALLACAPVAAQPDGFRYGITAGIDVSRGNYSRSQSTEIVYLPVSIRVDRGPWTARVTLAHLQVTGPAGASTFGNRSGARERQSGPGDVVLAITYATELTLIGTTYLDLTAKLKIPTADEDRGLGTGAADYTLQVEAFRSYGAWTPSAAIGYRALGDAPGVPLGGGFIASAGIDRRFANHVSAGALLDYREPASRRSDDALELVPYVSWRLGNGFALTGYGIVGLADGSPERGVGVQLSFRSGR